MMQAFPLSVPISIGGFLQLLYDGVFYYLFRRIGPPEERTGEPGSAAQ
jgi:hypothetical protein